MISDLSGEKIRRSEARKTWEGYWVHKDEWEEKHPQLSLRGLKDKQSVKPVRTRPADVFIGENNLLRSEEFDNSKWTKTNATIVADDIAASNGMDTADALVDDATNGEHSVEQSVSVTPQGAFVASVEALKGSQTYLLIKCYETGNSSNRINVWFNLSDGSVSSSSNSGTATGASGRITSRSIGDDKWYNCSALGTPSTSGTATTVVFQVTDVDGGTSYVGDSSDALYLFGGAAHAGDSPGNYVKTTDTVLSTTVTTDDL